MFNIHYTKKPNCYLAVLKDTGDRFYVANVQKTKGYPKKTTREYKSNNISLIKDGKFIKLNMSDSSARSLYGPLMDRLSAFIRAEEFIQQSNKEQEEKQYALLEQNLDDIDY